MMKLCKDELVREVARVCEVSLKDAKTILEAMLDSMVSALQRWERIELRTFGTFYPRKRSARPGRNPRTGAPVDVGPKTVPRFKPAQDLLPNRLAGECWHGGWPSQAGKRAFPMLGAYSSAKAAVILLTQAMAHELGGSGISVNAVCPGTVDTDLTNKDGLLAFAMGGEKGLESFIQREIPLGRLQTPEEIAAAICWLLSDDAEGVTGEALNVSAGQTMV
ncbi:MAG: SDR family oxidoreductase [Actinobacteria bacterium ATB1]|nr:SDR family oxidoreductase [Actinobacteria bacterium ATB1]